MRVKVLSGVERRRRLSRDENMRILAKSFEPGVTALSLARRNDVAPTVLFTWRQEWLPAAASTTMVPCQFCRPNDTPMLDARL